MEPEDEYDEAEYQQWLASVTAAGLIGSPINAGQGLIAQIHSDEGETVSSAPITYEQIQEVTSRLGTNVIGTANTTSMRYLPYTDYVLEVATDSTGANQSPMRQVREMTESSIEEHIQNDEDRLIRQDIALLQSQGITLQEIAAPHQASGPPYVWIVSAVNTWGYTPDPYAPVSIPQVRTIAQTPRMMELASLIRSERELMAETEAFYQRQREQQRVETTRQMNELARLEEILLEEERIRLQAERESITERVQDCEWVRNSELTVTQGVTVALKWKRWLDAISPVLDALFSQGWDVSFTFDNRQQVLANLCVLFPELIVSDTVRDHPIKDLYVRIRFASNMSLTGVLNGTRGELTDREYHSNYAHSHLQTHGVNGFTHFCKGNSVLTEITTRLGLRGFFNERMGEESDEVDPESVEMFEAYLHQLHAFMCHEATEGTPYRKIANIGRGSSNQVTQEELKASLDKFLLLTQGQELPVTFVGDIPCLTYNETLEKLLVQAAVKTQYRSPDGIFYSTETIPGAVLEMTRNPSFTTFEFRGQQINQKITHPKTEDNIDKRKYCHEAIRQHIIQTINARVAERFIGWNLEARVAASPTGLSGVACTEKLRTLDSKTRSLIKALESIVQGASHRVDGRNVLPHVRRKPRKAAKSSH